MHHDLAAQASTERLILQDCRIGKAQGGEIKHGIAHTAVPFSLLFVGPVSYTHLIHPYLLSHPALVLFPVLLILHKPGPYCLSTAIFPFTWEKTVCNHF